MAQWNMYNMVQWMSLPSLRKLRNRFDLCVDVCTSRFTFTMLERWSCKSRARTAMKVITISWTCCGIYDWTYFVCEWLDISLVFHVMSQTTIFGKTLYQSFSAKLYTPDAYKTKIPTIIASLQNTSLTPSLDGNSISLGVRKAEY